MKTLTPAKLAALAFVALAACNRDRPANEPANAVVVDRDGDGLADNDVVDRDRDGVDRDGVDRDHDGVGMQPASRVSSAAESIAQARCAREQRCDNVGADEKYSSASDCLARIRNDWKDDLNARECPGGVEQDDLQECLTAIRNEDCNSPFDTLGRLAECTAAQICDSDADDDD
jgi:hypothetical protein